MHPAQAQALCNLMNAVAATWHEVGYWHDNDGWRINCYRFGEDVPAVSVKRASFAAALIECLPDVPETVAAAALVGAE